MGKTSYDKNLHIIITEVNIIDKDGKTVSKDKKVCVKPGVHSTIIDNDNVKKGNWDKGPNLTNDLGSGIVFAGGRIEVETEKRGGGNIKIKACTMPFHSIIVGCQDFQRLKEVGIHGILGIDQLNNIKADPDIYDRDTDTPKARIERDKEEEEPRPEEGPRGPRYRIVPPKGPKSKGVKPIKITPPRRVKPEEVWPTKAKLPSDR